MQTCYCSVGYTCINCRDSVREMSALQARLDRMATERAVAREERRVEMSRPVTRTVYTSGIDPETAVVTAVVGVGVGMLLNAAFGGEKKKSKR